MKNVLVLLSLISCSFSFQAMAIDWTMISRTTEMASNKSEFLTLQAKYPTYFESLDAATVKTASLTFSKFKFTGTTTCPLESPKLIQEFVARSVCFLPEKEEDTNGVCQVGSIGPFSETDPCAE